MSRHDVSCVCTPCCDNDAMRDNPIHDNDRQEARAARGGVSELQASCGQGRHHMVPDGRGGGNCRYCPETVDASEL